MTDHPTLEDLQLLAGATATLTSHLQGLAYTHRCWDDDDIAALTTDNIHDYARSVLAACSTLHRQATHMYRLAGGTERYPSGLKRVKGKGPDA